MKITCLVVISSMLGLAGPMGAQSQQGDQRPGATGGPPAVAGANQAQSQAAALWDSIVAGGPAVPTPTPGKRGQRGGRSGGVVSQFRRAVRSLPADDTTLRPKLCDALKQHADALKQLSHEHPIQSNVEKALVTFQLDEISRLPVEKIPALPSARNFPGAVPAEARRVTRQVEINTSKPGWDNTGIYSNPGSRHWHSTGLYAAPGEVITVQVPEAVAEKGFRVRIGAHTDTLWNLARWERWPEISAEWPIIQTETVAANAFGGLVYIESPLDCRIPTFAAQIKGAVEAPRFVLGETDPAAWRNTIRNLSAPWGELETRKCIITLPAAALKKVEDPVELMKFWDIVMDRYADLAGRPYERHRAERYVPDIQISAGYMHSGYPLMTGTDMSDVFVDKQRIMSNAHNGVWGLFHEMGHNHQNADWTFDGTVEVTENLFSLYAFEKICHSDPLEAHPALAKGAWVRNMNRYFAGGARFEQWKQDPFVGLIMYIQLKNAFGWEPFVKTFRQYQELPSSERPKSDEQKRDQWMVRFSQTIGKNLGPFFQAWGIPTSEQARDSIQSLPQWLPENFPPKAEAKEGG
jgi:hypothetical protein